MSRWLIVPFVFVFLAQAGQSDTPDAAPEPLRVGASGLQDLQDKVSGRNDLLDQTEVEGGTRYAIEAGQAAYYFTRSGQPEHDRSFLSCASDVRPAAMPAVTLGLRGRVQAGVCQ